MTKKKKQSKKRWRLVASLLVASLPGGEVTINRTDPSRRTNEQLTDIPESRKGVYLFCFSTNCSLFGRSISLGHYPSIYQQAWEGFIYFITLRTISPGERTKIVPVSFVDFFVFLVRNCQPAFYFIRHWLLQKIIFCFPWPVKSLAWTLPRFLAFIPSK